MFSLIYRQRRRILFGAFFVTLSVLISFITSPIIGMGQLSIGMIAGHIAVLAILAILVSLVFAVFVLVFRR